jgi:hypothetical protein
LWHGLEAKVLNTSGSPAGSSKECPGQESQETLGKAGAAGLVTNLLSTEPIPAVTACPLALRTCVKNLGLEAVPQ